MSSSDTESSHASTGDDFEDFFHDLDGRNIEPYRFEPQISDDSSGEDDGELADNQEPEDLGRLRDTEW